MSSQSARAFWVTRPGHGEIRVEDLPTCNADQVLVRTLYSAISRGTEALVFNGRVPVSQHSRMRAPFQVGEFPAPIKYGYINVGEVEQGPSELLGRTVFCLYPHQDRYLIAASDVLPLPLALPAARAILAANMETAINALWDFAPRIGDRITVIGAGTLGCLLAWLASRVPGAEVELVDINPARASIATALGVDFAHPDEARAARDVVFHASASSSGLNRALELADFEATIVELSWYGDEPVAVALGADFHSRRLQLISSQVGAVAASRRNQRTHRERLQLALQLLCDPILDHVISAQSAFDELPSVMARLANGTLDSICHRISY
ncbi:MAG: threonine dehydrogenase-like Zn-dependent dehydrogenase [Gammaproteobacteria bacterium]|jgi:threonine dehydrogenase-like Zn-dependent dehydrogenase